MTHALRARRNRFGCLIIVLFKANNTFTGFCFVSFYFYFFSLSMSMQLRLFNTFGRRYVKITLPKVLSEFYFDNEGYIVQFHYYHIII